MMKRFHTFNDALNSFMRSDVCVAGFQPIDEDEALYRECEIKIHVYETGAGYIHLLGEDSTTVDFLSFENEAPKILTEKERSKNKAILAKIKKAEQNLELLKKSVIEPHPANLNVGGTGEEN